MEKPAYWFPAKRFGYGWGLPCTWQGWLVVGAYMAAIALLVWELKAQGDQVSFVTGAVALTLLLMLVCLIKGEPLRWRRGGK
jgi:hypothetical protein